MARISRNLSISWNDGAGNTITGRISQNKEQVGNAAIGNVQTVGSSSEVVLVGDVSGVCNVFFKNNNLEWDDLDAAVSDLYDDEDDYNDSNRVYIGTTNPTTSGNATYALKPGNGIYFENTYVPHYAIRDTADVDLLAIVIEV
jgi:hypothetical protein